jgi:hypothetical protein
MHKIDPHVGGSYTREQFIAEYDGTAEWDEAEAAEPPPVVHRKMSLIRRLQPPAEYDDPDRRTLFRPRWYQVRKTPSWPRSWANFSLF